MIMLLLALVLLLVLVLELVLLLDLSRGVYMWTDELSNATNGMTFGLGD